MPTAPVQEVHLSTQLLTTQRFAPVSPLDLALRPRLVAWLTEGLASQLTLGTLASSGFAQIGLIAFFAFRYL
jgi:hypothetical protein